MAAEVFKFATRIMGTAMEEALVNAGMTADQMDLFIPHQANLRIIEAASKRLNLPPEKVFVNIESTATPRRRRCRSRCARLSSRGASSRAHIWGWSRSALG